MYNKVAESLTVTIANHIHVHLSTTELDLSSGYHVSIMAIMVSQKLSLDEISALTGADRQMGTAQKTKLPAKTVAIEIVVKDASIHE